MAAFKSKVDKYSHFPGLIWNLVMIFFCDENSNEFQMERQAFYPNGISP